MSLTLEDVTTMMQILDADGDGDVSKAEFKAYFMTLPINREKGLTNKDFEAIWKKMDRNGDGNLQIEEICDYYHIDCNGAERALHEQKEMSEEMIMEALQLNSALTEARLEKEAKEKEKKLAEKTKRAPTGVRAGVTVLKMNQVKYTALDEYDPPTRFFAFCQLGEIDDARKLFDGGVEVRLEDENAEMPVHKLAKNGTKASLDLLKGILDRVGKLDVDLLMSDLNSRDKNGATALHHAVHKTENEQQEAETLKMINYLLAKGADPLVQTNTGHGICHKCAHDELFEQLKVVCEALASKPADLKTFVNLVDNTGRPPLHIAAYRAPDSLVRYLLDKGANPTSIDTNGLSAKDLALKQSGRQANVLAIDEMAEKAKMASMNYNRRRSISRDDMGPAGLIGAAA